MSRAALTVDAARAIGDVDPRLFGSFVEHIVLRDDDVYATSTASEPDRVRPMTSDTARFERGRLSAELPPLSWNVVLLRESRS